MDENTWRIVQIGMWILGIQTAFLTALIGAMWHSINNRFEKLDERISKLEHDMIEVKTILRMKECCMIQDERKLTKIE